MEWIFIALIVLGVVIWSRNRRQRQSETGRVGGSRPRRQLSAEELAGVRRTVDEDVTEFGEELQRLDVELGGRELDEGTRQDYQQALDAYEDAKTSAASITVWLIPGCPLSSSEPVEDRKQDLQQDTQAEDGDDRAEIEAAHRRQEVAHPSGAGGRRARAASAAGRAGDRREDLVLHRVRRDLGGGTGTPVGRVIPLREDGPP